MKTNYLKKWWAVLLLMLTMGVLQVSAQTLIFSQEFNGAAASIANNTIAQMPGNEYVNATTPNSNQFTNISVLGRQSSSGLAISGGTTGELVLTNNGTSFQWSIDRTIDFVDGAAPTAIQFEMRAKADVGGSGSNPAIFFAFGQNFTNNSIAKPADTNIHSAFQFRNENSAGFMLYSWAGSSITARQTEIYRVWKWVINASAEAMVYTAPTGAEETLPANTWDLWFDNTKILDNQAAVTSTAALKNFKFACPASNGRSSWNIDYIKIYDIGAPTVTEPTVEVEPGEISFGEVPQNENRIETVVVEGQLLTGDLSVVSSNTAFTVNTTTITQAQAEAGFNLKVTFNESEDAILGDYNDATITISGGGLADNIVIPVSGTIIAPDVSAPVITSISPDPTVPEELQLESDIIITFDENIIIGTGNITLNEEIIAPAIVDNVLTLTYSPLTPNTQYTLTIPVGALTDTAKGANAFAGGTWTWTSETPAPVITLTSTSKNAAVKAVSGYFEITFNIANATDATVANLPNGVDYDYDAGTLTISGTPTALTEYPGVYNYTISPTAMAGYDGAPVTDGGTITVKDPNSRNVAFLYDTTANNNASANILAGPPANKMTAALVAYDVTGFDRPTAANVIDICTSGDYDLVILHESLPSSNAGGLELGKYIGQIAILNTKPHMYGKANWPAGGGDNGSAQDMTIAAGMENHPIFKGVTIADGNKLAGGVGGTTRWVANPGAGTAIAYNAAGTTSAMSILEDLSGSEKYMLISISAAAEDVNANGLILFKNACDYLMGVVEPEPNVEPLKKFVMKWSDDAVISGGKTEAGTIEVAELSTDRNDKMEVYFDFAEGYENCFLVVNGTKYERVDIEWQGNVVGQGAYIDFGSSANGAIVQVVRPDSAPQASKGLQRAAGDPSEFGTVVAEYTLAIQSVGTGSNDINAKEKEVKDCFNVLGVQVDCESNGIVIKRFTDGSTEKTLKK